MDCSPLLVTIPAVPPTGPARVAWYRQVRAAIAADIARGALRLIEAGSSEDYALEVAAAQLAALTNVIEQLVDAAITVERWAA